MDCNWGWLAGLLLTLCLSSQLAIAEDVESPKDDIAAQIRADQPQSATRDAQASRPDEEVWLLRCEGASYRVRLILTWRRRLSALINKACRLCVTTCGERPACECLLMALFGHPTCTNKCPLSGATDPKRCSGMSSLVFADCGARQRLLAGLANIGQVIFHAGLDPGPDPPLTA
jgi:hypothetical protein